MSKRMPENENAINDGESEVEAEASRNFRGTSNWARDHYALEMVKVQR